MLNEETQLYLENFCSEKSGWMKQLEEIAELEYIPIMERVAIDFLVKQIDIHRPNRILEIGTAIGYSALRMAEANPEAEIMTIEKDEKRYKEALENIKKLGKSEQIDVIYGDALEVLQTLTEKKKLFDFIFIDAAKGKYKEFFHSAHQLLKNGGLLVTDNVLFRGYVANPGRTPKRYRNMVKKLIEYNELLHSHPDYITSILPIGDGVMFSYKRG